MPLLENKDAGLYCEAGDFYIDPRRKVERAVITHAHADHARPGCASYLCSESGAGLLRERVAKNAAIESIPFGRTVTRNSVRVSLHPAGHILGSAQIRVEYRGEVWVVTGDYKTDSDPTCEPFEPVTCDTFITETTFGLPIYRWPEVDSVVASMAQWWETNRSDGRISVIFAYSLGKAQRLIALLSHIDHPIHVHSAVKAFEATYRNSGIPLPECPTIGKDNFKDLPHDALVIMPPAASDISWIDPRKCSTAFASGWMLIRGPRRRRAAERGFPISDHVDWPSLNRVIEETRAKRIVATHGYQDIVVRWLREKGKDAGVLPGPLSHSDGA